MLLQHDDSDVNVDKSTARRGFQRLKMYLMQDNFMAKMCFCFSFCLKKKGSRRLKTMSKKLVIAGDIIKKKFDMRTVLMQLQQMTKDHEQMMRKLNLPLTSF